MLGFLIFGACMSFAGIISYNINREGDQKFNKFTGFAIIYLAAVLGFVFLL